MTNFELFWKSYPRKVGKGKARLIWSKLKVTEEQLGAILVSLEQQKCCRQWMRDNGQFIPHPSTWLGQKRWEDEPDNCGCEHQNAPAKSFSQIRMELLGK